MPQPTTEGWRGRCLAGAFASIAALTMLCPRPLLAQHTDGITIQGSVVDSAHRPVGDAAVHLEARDAAGRRDATTNAAGIYSFTAIPAGNYVLQAEKSGLRSADIRVIASSVRDPMRVELMLMTTGEPPPRHSGASTASSAQAMEFADKPDFTVAGVTDWTAVGGHGSDSTLRTSEDLARETRALKPDASAHETAHANSASEPQLRDALAAAPHSFVANYRLGDFYLRDSKYQEALPPLQSAYKLDPDDTANAYDLALAYNGAGEISQAREQVQRLLARKDTADAHRLAGEIDEKLGDPLNAVREDEKATRLDPNEQNYFQWGSELLLHRAVWQAVEVFENGAKAYPDSARMQAALGSALFAGARYDEAAQRLCQAADLSPSDRDPYLFLGKVAIAAPTALPCVEQKLARFARERPTDSSANYLYAMAIWKRQTQPADPHDLQQVEALLTKAITTNPKCAEAYLQLGILSSSQRNYEQATSYYSKALTVDPQLAEAHYRLGVAYDRIGETAKAKEEFALHDQIGQAQAAEVERQRREVKQFLIVLEGKPAPAPSH